MIDALPPLTLRPAELGRSDAETARAAGLSDDALVDVVEVGALFSMIVPLADALGWDVPTFDDFYARADQMLATGYKLE